MKKLSSALVLIALLILATTRPAVMAQTTSAVTPDAKRIARLAALGKLWGTVKYFHPYLAYKKLDWDGALIATIPKVNAAKSGQEYLAAINHLLSYLHDPNTVAELASAPKPSAPVTPPAAPAADPAADPAARYLRATDGVLVVDVTGLVQLRMSDEAAFWAAIRKLYATGAEVSAVVWDLRGTGPTDPAETGRAQYYLTAFVTAALGAVIDTPVTFGASRFRLQNGYAPQVGGSSGGYYSGLVTSSPQTAQPGRKKLPLAVVINRYTPDVSENLSGLQVANAATVIQSGEMPNELGAPTYSLDLPDGITARIRTSELVNPDGTIGFRADRVVAESAEPTSDSALTAAIQAVKQPIAHIKPADGQSSVAPQSYLDDPYARMEFPDNEYRLLALFRFWNVINYFFPYKHLLEGNWDDVLTQYIPVFEANKEVFDYQRTVRQLATQIHDSHGFVAGTQKLDDAMGNFFPPVGVHLVEGQTVITMTNQDGAAAGLKVGDVVSTVDGEPVAARLDRFGRLIAASTPQSLQSNSHLYLLRGAKDSKAVFGVKGADGKPRQVEVARSVSFGEYYGTFFEPPRALPVFTILPSGFGYIDLARLLRADVDKAMDAVMKTPGLIFDMRGYPNSTAGKIASRLTSRRNIIAALFRRPIREGAALGNADYVVGTDFGFPQQLPPPTGTPYLGLVAMLINEEAISQSEHTCMFFEAATKVTFVGTPTAGANGDTTNLVLPGGIYVYFSGHDVRHADGRQLQRVGIQPDIKIAPTIRGIREKRDEILEAAVKFLQRKPK